MPEAEKVVLLLRTTLLTLNDALQTGNFTVLRDVSAPMQPTLAAPLAAAAPVAPTALEAPPKQKVEPAKIEVPKK
jgi:hypothetical protein